MAEELEIKIKYISKDIDKIEKIDIGDWIDLRAAEETKVFYGHRAMIPLGIAMKLPEGYEAILAPRSSLQKKGIIMGNSIGIIDNSYCGNDDQWHFPAMCVAEPKNGWDGKLDLPYVIIEKNERICQFRIQKIHPKIKFVEVDDLGAPSRGGLGSTGEVDFKRVDKQLKVEDFVGPKAPESDVADLVTLTKPISYPLYEAIKNLKNDVSEYHRITYDNTDSKTMAEDKMAYNKSVLESLRKALIEEASKTTYLLSNNAEFNYKNINPDDKYEFKDGSETTCYKLFTAIMVYSTQYYPEREADFNKLRDLIIKGWLRPENAESLGSYIHRAMKEISTMN